VMVASRSKVSFWPDGSTSPGNYELLFVCTSIRLTSLVLCTFSNWEKQFLHLFKILWESARRSTYSSYTKVPSDWCPS
jgi:hypothetical protein